MEQEEPLLHIGAWPVTVIKYKVTVHTGKKLGAGTDANVFLNIFGEQGDTGERFLEKSSTNKNKFEKGSVSFWYNYIFRLLEIKEFKYLSKINYF